MSAERNPKYVFAHTVDTFPAMDRWSKKRNSRFEKYLSGKVWFVPQMEIETVSTDIKSFRSGLYALAKRTNREVRTLAQDHGLYVQRTGPSK